LDALPQRDRELLAEALFEQIQKSKHQQSASDAGEDDYNLEELKKGKSLNKPYI
jgi:hypothetical protein